MKSVAFHNLGCKVNSYELEVMRQMLQEKGYQVVPFEEVADIYIVNTCTVTNIADRKSRQMLHQAKKRNPGAVVVAVGCYVQTGEEAALQDASIDLAVGNNRKKDLPAILEEYLALREASEGIGKNDDKDPVKNCGDTDKTLGGTTVIDIGHTSQYEEMTLRHTSEHARAYIKIQDGCNQFCSYCVIPYARGRVRSRRREDILEEIRGLAAAGYREIVLTGIHISSYGIDFGERDKTVGCLIDLLEEIHGIDGIARIRLGSLEPRIVTEEAARRLAALPKLCPHFHLSLQSGCDATLKRMNRHYTTGEYLQNVELLRREFGDPAITTDVIVGFPGETEEEFAESRNFLEKVGFYEMHVFKYSKRAGTRAAVMPNQVPEQLKALRSNTLLALESAQSRAFRSRRIGRETEVLWEEYKEIAGRTFLVGHTGDYVKIAVPAGEEDGPRSARQPGVNDLSRVQVQGFLTDEILLGE